MRTWILRSFPGLATRLLSLLVPLLLAAAPRGAEAQVLKTFKNEAYEGNPDLEKVSSGLIAVRKRVRDGLSVAQAQRVAPSVPVARGGVEIDVRLTQLTPDVVARLEAAGMQIDEAYPEYARAIGTCDPLLLDRVAAISEVRTIHPNYRPLVSVGAVTSQADTLIRAAQARAELGVDGSGVPIGILSDSFDSAGSGTVTGTGCARAVSGTSSQVSGDLPPSVVVLQDVPGRTDEGRAMAELIHDLAPGAPLLFATAFTSEPGFAAAIDALRACGAKVLVDDVLYFAEPMFQDGVVAQAAQAAVDAGIPFFSSAGNYGRFGIEADYVDGAPADPDNNFHLFGPGNQVANVTLPSGCGARFVLQWAEPFDGALGPGASTDFDIALFDCTSGFCQLIPGAIADSPQGCFLQGGGPGGDPIEVLESPINNSGTPRTVSLAVNRACGSARRFRIGVSRVGPCSLTSGYVFDSSFDAPQIYGHAAAAGVVAVAAVDYREIEQAGTRQPPSSVINVEPFSSLGGSLRFFFGPNGVPLPGGPQLRAKPELAAPDGTNTTFFGVNVDGDAFPNFSGTSAAAPHAAAVAALIREQSPLLAPASILSLLASTAIDIETPGFDFLSGFGLIDALDAVSAASEPGPPVGVLENPQPGSSQSGIGVVSGWVCDATSVKYQIDDGPLVDTAYGTPRADTEPVCGDTNNGFGALFNWSLLGDGPHTLRLFADGVELASATFEVATLGVPFLSGASGEYELDGFPAPGESTVLRWQEASQNFVIAGRSAASGVAPGAAAPQAASLGVLENPQPGSAQSGIGVISGWVCDASVVTVRIDGGPPIVTAYGTGRADTQPVCGDANNGFGALFNWSLLGDGPHTLTAFADGMPLGEASFTVTTFGTSFLSGVEGKFELPGFAGRDVTVRWQEALQSFVIVGAE